MADYDFDEGGEPIVSFGVLVLATNLARYTDVELEVILLEVTHLCSAPPLTEAQQIAKNLKLPGHLEEVEDGLRIVWDDSHPMATIGDLTFVRNPDPFAPPHIDPVPS